MHPRLIGRYAFIALLALSTAISTSARDYSRVENYNGFVEVTVLNGQFVNASTQVPINFNTENYLYLPPRQQDYVIDNSPTGPYGGSIAINRTTPLYFHGGPGDRNGSRVIWTDLTRPLFRIDDATLLNISGLHIEVSNSATPPPLEVVAIEVATTNAIQFEMQDASLRQAKFLAAGNGTYRFQSVVFSPNGYVEAAVVVDHDDADVWIIGGNASNGNVPSTPASDPYYFRQKQGRLRIVGTGVQATLGNADFRFDAGSDLGSHQVIQVRSEGTKVAGTVSALAYVPATPAGELPVDLLLLGNDGAWDTSGAGNGHFADYNGDGTLWAVSNTSRDVASSIVKGGASAKHSTIVALANWICEDDDPLPVASFNEHAAGNVFTCLCDGDNEPGCGCTGGTCAEQALFIDPGASLGAAPRIPEVVIPRPLPRPRVLAPLPGMVRVTDYLGQNYPNCTCSTGGSDDTCAIQAAFDDAMKINLGNGNGTVFFDAGNYSISCPLKWLHTDQQYFGPTPSTWIAGPGDLSTTIANTAGGNVFETEGMGWSVVQGLTFKSDAYTSGDTHRAMWIENSGTCSTTTTTACNTNVTGECPSGEQCLSYHYATQENRFYDCTFDGGQYAAGLGFETLSSSSEHMFINSTFKNAHVGLGVGSQNALANMAYDVRFEDNEIAFGHDPDVTNINFRGGSWTVLYADIEGTTDHDIGLYGGENGLYHYGLNSGTEQVASLTAQTGGGYSVVIDHSHFYPSSGPADTFELKRNGGGFTFINSELSDSTISLNLASVAPSWAINAYSSIDNFATTAVNPGDDELFALSDLQCVIDISCATGCNPVPEPQCFDFNQEVSTCVAAGETEICPPGEEWYKTSCPCKNSSGKFCLPLEDTSECRCEGGASCDDGLYCNGQEFCDSQGCISGAPPCGGSEACDEVSDVCFIPPACPTENDCGPSGTCSESTPCNDFGQGYAVCRKPSGALFECPAGQEVALRICPCNASGGTCAFASQQLICQ